jgi:hypothetical protein
MENPSNARFTQKNPPFSADYVKKTESGVARCLSHIVVKNTWGEVPASLEAMTVGSDG